MLWMFLGLKLVSEYAAYVYSFSPCILYISTTKVFQFLILLDKFLSTYYNILKWHNQLITDWVSPYINGA